MVALVFARDNTLFVTQGDRGDYRDKAQDLSSGLGKIVRLNLDGTVPHDNPFVGLAGARPEIWSYGHRNVQAAAVHPDTGQLWTVEHGAQGGDELNHPEAGKNYGWPMITYGVDYGGATLVKVRKAGYGAARVLLGPGDRPLRHGFLHRRCISWLEREYSHWFAEAGPAASASLSRTTKSCMRNAISRTFASVSARCSRGPTAYSICSRTTATDEYFVYPRLFDKYILKSGGPCRGSLVSH